MMTRKIILPGGAPNEMNYSSLLNKLKKGVALADRGRNVRDITRFNSNMEQQLVAAAVRTKQIDKQYLGAFGQTDILAQLQSGDFLPNEFIGILFGSHPLGGFKDAIVIFFLSFFVIAFLEEIVKFEVLYTITSKTRTCDQIIDYIKLGIAVGLGFATAENVYYFFVYHWDQLFTVTTVFILRFSLTTLAHILYGAVLGYYLGHAACNRIREKTFIRKGITASVLLHGFFNFLVFTGTAFYNVILVLIILGVLIKWFHDRRLFEKIITEPSSPSLIEKPIMAEPVEIESFFSVRVMNNAERRVILKEIGRAHV